MRQRQMLRPPCQQPVSGANGPPATPGEVAGQTYMPALTPGTHIYSADGIKQELIQIPQLSSSTSSPDSSPSPGQTLNSHGQHPFVQPGAPTPHPPHHGPAPPGTGSSIQTPGSGELKWVPSGSPSTANVNTVNALSSPNKNCTHYHYGGAPSTATTGTLSSGVAALQLTGSGSGKVIPAVIREFQLSIPDDKEWQSQLFGLLQNQTYNQCEVDLFELMCKVIDQSLFAQVDWARNSVFFKDLKVCSFVITQIIITQIIVTQITITQIIIIQLLLQIHYIQTNTSHTKFTN